MSDLELRKGKTKVENKAFVLFIYLIPNKKLNSDLENLFSLSVIYRFIGFRHEITDNYAPLTENTTQTEQ